MPNKKLTDSEIIKALKCCIKAEKVRDCEKMGCPLSLGNCQGCKYVDNENGLYKDAFDLINRLQAKNDKLQKEMEMWKNTAYHEASQCETAKAEAYKEFVKKLHEELRIYGIKDKFNKSVFLNVVDKAKKELVGDSE
jgi:hypothetical protein